MGLIRIFLFVEGVNVGRCVLFLEKIRQAIRAESSCGFYF